MKNTKWVGLVAALAFPLLVANAQTPAPPAPGAPAQAPAVAPVNLSPGAAEVVRLAGSGVGDDVVVAYIQNSQAPFTLAADDVLYLKDIGLSPQVTSAMLTHDSGLRNQGQQYAPAAPAAPVPAAPPGNAPLTQQWQSPGAPPAPAPAQPPPPNAAPPPNAPPPSYVTSAPADVSYFYNDLAPYGSWVSLEGYGWCWQPRTVVVSHSWRPYCDGGHWVYTDAGWFWQSDYSWGWAPFHYGRWYMHPSCGWVWTPDRVWGPAWVTWRVAGDNCGWAPLPPHANFDVRLGWQFNGVSVGASFGFGLGFNAFAFVSFGNFCNHNLGPHCLPPTQVRTVYNQTTIINNYVVKNNTIVHGGVPIERVSAASHVPVPRATIRDLPAGSTRMPAQGGAVVYRPQLHAPAQHVNMVAQKVDPGHPVIQHTSIAAVRTGYPSTYSRSGSAPGAASHPSATGAAGASTWSSGAKPLSSQQHPSTAGSYQSTPATGNPQSSAWSSGAKPASSLQSQSTARTYQPATTATTATTPRALDEWKQGSRSTSGYRSTGQSSSAATTSSEVQNPHVYQPKSHLQAAEIHSLPKTEQHESVSPASPARSSDVHSQKNEH